MSQHPFLLHEYPLRFAHRGSTILWPENTLMAFQGAVSQGCIYIESDLHVTKDGVIVMFHDDTLDRVTNGKGPVRCYNWNELNQLDAAYYFKPEEGFPYRNQRIGIPALAEAMTTFPEVKFNLDLKQPGIEAVVAAFINRYHYHDRVLISSFTGSRTVKCQKLMTEPVAVSAGVWEVFRLWSASRIGKACDTWVHAVQIPRRKWGIELVDETFIRFAHNIGIHIHVWTINSATEMRELLKMGVDGIITDRIDLLNSQCMI